MGASADGGGAALWETAIDEIVRFRGPILGTQLQSASQDLELAGGALPRGTAVMALLGAANHDPCAFERPEVFDVGRSSNHHLGFGFGTHFCLGRRLSRMETRIALRRLFERQPELRLAVDPGALELQSLPGWHRHARLPIRFR